MPTPRTAVLTAVMLAALAFIPAGAARQPSSFDALAKASLAQIDGRARLRGLRDSVEVIRDRWGVPHIYAKNTEDLFFAQGFVQAQDRLWQMEMYRRTYEGTLAEILGPAYVSHDQLVRLLKYRGPWDDREWTSYHPEGKKIFDAFANGVNAFIAQAGERLPVEFKLTGIKPQPWTADIALLRTQTAMPTGNAVAELRLAADVVRLGVDSANKAARPSPYRDLVVPSGVDLSQVTAAVRAGLDGMVTGVIRPELLPEYRSLAGADASANTGVQENSPGSNNWVVSGKLTASGNVIVANDPHRNVANPSIRYIVHLNAPGWNVIGATEPVLPGVAIGHNGRIGWGLTIVGTDQSDVYVEEVNPANPNEVKFRGQWEPLRIVRDTIRVKGAPPVAVAYKFSRHGPVFHEDAANRKAYAMRSTMYEPGNAGYVSALRYHALDNCRQFLDAQVYYKAPTENMICGDRDGNIAWQASAASPKRPNWHGRLPVPGTGEFEWDGLRNDLPREFNPERGWIATANHDIHPQGYDPPLFFKNGPEDQRFRRIADVLVAKRGFTIADFEALQHDAYSAPAARDIPLFRGWQASDPEVERARAQIAAWDAQFKRESMAPLIYRAAAPAIPAEARAPGTSAVRRGELLQGAIARALDTLRAEFGADASQWRWGRRNTSQLPHTLVKAYDIPPVERHGGAGFVAAVGATYREIMDMGNVDASVATNVPGQSGQPGSPFYSNLVESYGRAEYFPLAYSRAAVERAAAHRLALVPVR
ncbi:MAG: penicillin acylase family protein [Gemmatimonadetes bacterium]|nr:penicillin acylase family protein [Gemmatimonadota bacterium]